MADYCHQSRWIRDEKWKLVVAVQKFWQTDMKHFPQNYTVCQSLGSHLWFLSSFVTLYNNNVLCLWKKLPGCIMDESHDSWCWIPADTVFLIENLVNVVLLLLEKDHTFQDCPSGIYCKAQEIVSQYHAMSVLTAFAFTPFNDSTFKIESTASRTAHIMFGKIKHKTLWILYESM